jgi:hypothetical protein
MGNPTKRGESSGQVSTWANPNDSFTPLSQTSFLNPYGLTLRQTITSSGSVTIPAGITWVYVVMTSGGGGSFFGYAGNGGEVTWGWTIPQTSCVIGAGGLDGQNGGFTRYGHLIATGVGTRGASNRPANYYGQPPGTSFGDLSAVINGTVGANAGGGSSGNTGFQGGNGGDGISGGNGGSGSQTTATATGGNGGSGLTGGGGGAGLNTSGTRIGGNGGNGLGIDGTVYTGGTGTTTTASNNGGGGGAGIAGNGGNASGATGGTGGVGGGGAGKTGTGGAGILYIFY